MKICTQNTNSNILSTNNVVPMLHFHCRSLETSVVSCILSLKIIWHKAMTIYGGSDWPSQSSLGSETRNYLWCDVTGKIIFVAAKSCIFESKSSLLFWPFKLLTIGGFLEMNMSTAATQRFFSQISGQALWPTTMLAVIQFSPTVNSLLIVAPRSYFS